jgi:hypothetical protein
MIGKIKTGKSFGGCIRYLLENKIEVGNKIGNEESRAEILSYNRCFGLKNELIQQFNDVRKLNPGLKSPVFHIILSLAKEDELNKAKKIEVAERCAEHFGVNINQFLVLEHHDTPDHSHLHIVANRIGYDKVTASDSNSYQRMAGFCRKMELEYGLKKVLSPKRFLPQQEQQLPRNDMRKENLKATISSCIKQSSGMDNLAENLRLAGISMEVGRGVTFVDDKLMRVKGSDLGFALSKIQKQLSQNIQNRPLYLNKQVKQHKLTIS